MIVLIIVRKNKMQFILRLFLLSIFLLIVAFIYFYFLDISMTYREFDSYLNAFPILHTFNDWVYFIMNSCFFHDFLSFIIYPLLYIYVFAFSFLILFYKRGALNDII